jgi:hypothetical protein
MDGHQKRSVAEMASEPLPVRLAARGKPSRRRSRWLRRPEASTAVAIVTLVAAWIVLVG